VVLFAKAAQQLHPEANPQHRLSTGLNQFDKIAFAQLIHRRLSGTDAR
jgi:hypothetical protein